jgi:hypothetical protein
VGNGTVSMLSTSCTIVYPTYREPTLEQRLYSSLSEKCTQQASLVHHVPREQKAEAQKIIDELFKEKLTKTLLLLCSTTADTCLMGLSLEIELSSHKVPTISVDCVEYKGNQNHTLVCGANL